MSGFTQKELHHLTAIYRLAEMPPTLSATLTSISENWTLSQLLEELAAEAEAMKRQKKRLTSYTPFKTTGSWSKVALYHLLR